MSTKKNYRKHTAAFKTRVVLEALKERETLSELGHRYQLHPTPAPASLPAQPEGEFWERTGRATCGSLLSTPGQA